MIKIIKKYKVICDVCGIEVDEQGWGSLSYLLDIAFIRNWIEHDDGNYCPDCYEFDENENIVIKNKEKQNE